MDRMSIVTMLDHLEERAEIIHGDEDGYGYYRGFLRSYLFFIEKIYGLDHQYLLEEESMVSHDRAIESILEILSSIRKEIESGFLFLDLKELVRAELFSDYLGMAEHLLDNGYKDAAAVIIGSTLENHLRQLCISNSIDIEEKKDDGREVPLNSGRLNTELLKNKVYNKLQFKNITAWLDIRNNSAHGNYDEYSKEQVSLMLSGVMNFLPKFFPIR